MSISHHESPSLQVFQGDTCIFTHTGKWLHPLFALEQVLETHSFDPRELYLRDRIIGKAAALLIFRMGIRRVYGELISNLATEYLIPRAVDVDWGTKVPRIECRTEELLAAIDDPEEAYGELRGRAGLT